VLGVKPWAFELTHAWLIARAVTAVVAMMKRQVGVLLVRRVAGVRIGEKVVVTVRVRVRPIMGMGRRTSAR